MNKCGLSAGPSNRSNSVSSLDLEVESVSEGGPGPSGSNGAEALQLLEHEQGEYMSSSISPSPANKLNMISCRNFQLEWCSLIITLGCSLCSHYTG